MSNVEIYRRIGGRKVEKVLAMTGTVQAALDKAAFRIAAEATASLENKDIHPYSEGKSFITIGRGKVDRGVILNDPDGDAWAIEKGTKRSRGINALVAGLMSANVKGG